MEQELIEDLVIESIRIHGVDCWYLTRTTGAKDELLNEDDLPIYQDAHMLEMYIRSVDGFEGEGDFLSKFGLQIRDSMTLSVAIRSYEQEVGIHTENIRPNEGDVIYFPLNEKFFQVVHVEHESIFYQMGQLQMYDLRCELFEHSGERFETGEEFIDTHFEAYDNWVPSQATTFLVKVENGVFSMKQEDVQGEFTVQPELYDFFADQTYVFDQTDPSNAGFPLSIADGPERATGALIVGPTGTPGSNNAVTTWSPTVDGTYYYTNYEVDSEGMGAKIVVGESKLQNIESYDAIADNSTIESEADNILDFSELNPFGEDEF